MPASVGGYDRDKAETVLPQLYPLFAVETNSGMRLLPLGVFAHLAEFATGEELEKAADLLLLEMLGDSAPLAFQTFLPAADPVPSRKFNELYRVTSHLSGPAAGHFADEILWAMAKSTNISQTIALGKAVHRAYAKRDLMKIPSLEDYEQRAAVKTDSTS